MGADGRAYVVLGIRCMRENFLIPNGYISKCAKGHEATSPKDPFCAKDGTAFKQHAVETPTEALVDWALANDYESGQAMYDALCEEEGHDYGIHSVEPVASSEDREPRALAFGFKLFSQDGERGHRDSIPIEVKDILKRAKELKTQAKALGIEGEPKLYLTFYWS